MALGCDRTFLDWILLGLGPDSSPFWTILVEGYLAKALKWGNGVTDFHETWHGM